MSENEEETHINYCAVSTAITAGFNHYTKLMTFKAVQKNQKIWQIIYYAYVGLHDD